MQNIVRKLDSVVAAGAAAFRHDGTHDLVNDSQHFILAVTQLIHEARTPLWVFAAIKTVQLCCNAVQLLVGVVELSQKRSIRLLQQQHASCGNAVTKQGTEYKFEIHHDTTLIV